MSRPRERHGYAPAGQPAREYRIWTALRTRCLNPRVPHFRYYGGRGIKVCARWAHFTAFLADMGPCPTEQHSIDRIDNDGDYSPVNCRWATRTEQNRNSRNVRPVTIFGVTRSCSFWAELAEVSPATFQYRLDRGLRLLAPSRERR